jgi:hypothetical protein
MNTKLFKSTLAIFFLLLFASGKAFGYHILLHDHDTQIIECEVCDKALVDQFSPLDNADIDIDLSIDSSEFYDTHNNHYVSKNYSTELFSVLFSRPPPFLN